jgi:hypothetical protein
VRAIYLCSFLIWFALIAACDGKRNEYVGNSIGELEFTEAELEIAKQRAEAGDNQVTLTLAWYYASKDLDDSYWLNLAAKRGDCLAIQLLHEDANTKHPKFDACQIEDTRVQNLADRFSCKIERLDVFECAE